MILYHGSNQIVRHPDVLHSRDAVDFGRGFYATVLREQAERWCQRFIRFGDEAYVNIYHLDDQKLLPFSICSFDSYSAEWLDYVTACRLNADSSSYDVVVGGVANDRVFNTCELYFKKLIDKDAALDRLRFEEPTNQYCFRTQRVIDACLSFEEAHAV